MTGGGSILERATQAAESVVDPELPMLTLGDLGVLRAVELVDDTVIVTITPTYTGCPAMATMRADLRLALRRAGCDRVDVRTSLSPVWTTDWITARGRAALRDNGISPPTASAAARTRRAAPVALTLVPPPERVACPRCASGATAELSRFGSTPCTSLHVCSVCGETFPHVKAI